MEDDSCCFLIREFIRQNLVKSAKNTFTAKENNFVAINSAATFSSIIPLTDYELIRPYIEKIKSGESDVLWPGQLNILLRHLELLRVLNIYPSLRKVCLIILVLPEMLY